MALNQKAAEYKITFQPLISTNIYQSTEVDVTRFLADASLPKIKKLIDADDYDFGVYSYGDVTLKCQNSNGKFNDLNDSRSIFPYLRDRCKVFIKYVEFGVDGAETETTLLKGLISDEGTREDPFLGMITFRVLSIDSVIRNNKVASGVVSNGASIQATINSILNDTKVLSVLNVSLSNINPDQETTIDNASSFTDQPMRDALNELLRVSNSVMIIDSSDNVIVKSRGETTTNVLNLFGPDTQTRTENIIDISQFNSGLHRMFTSVVFNTQQKEDTGLIIDYGTRQKKIEVDWITDTTKEATIAARLLREFKVPKMELVVTVRTSLAKDVDLLDRVSIDYPLRIKPITAKELPVIGVTAIGETTEPLPKVFGSTFIHPNSAWKVIEIMHSPGKFETKLKLRQKGVNFSDGVFNEPGNCRVGTALIGECILTSGATDAQFNPSVLGGAVIGSTEAA